MCGGGSIGASVQLIDLPNQFVSNKGLCLPHLRIVDLEEQFDCKAPHLISLHEFS
jgi:hypothetical protein